MCLAGNVGGRWLWRKKKETRSVIQINVNNGPFTNGHAVMKMVSIDCMLSLYPQSEQ